MPEIAVPGLDQRYRIERELGRGGMGAVYLARDLTLDRLVAVKVLPSELAAEGDLRERFLRETRTAASFSHPNIVPVHGVEESEQLLAFTMGYVEGESLAARVRRTGPLPLRDAVSLLQDVGWALAYAHGRGVVHRDIKPDNILLDRTTGRALVTDFGIARTITPAAGNGLTRIGEVVGTPEFMSPEQAVGDAIDGRSDLYSLGLVAFFALTGELAVSGDTSQKVLARQLTEPAPPIASRRDDLPPALAEAVDRLLLKDPTLRFASAEALVEALEASQLAVPDVPVPIRILAQDFGQTGLVSAFMLVIAFLLQRNAELRNLAALDAALPAIFFFAIIGGRVASSVARARQVMASGFSPSEILAGFARMAAEQEGERTRLRQRPELRAERRRVVRRNVGLLVVAVASIAFALRFRVQIGPQQFEVPLAATILFLVAIIMIGVALVGLVRNPLRASLTERLFGWVWGGAFGRLFLRLAARGRTGPSAAERSLPFTGGGPARAVSPSAHDARLAALEARVTALEQR